MTSPLSWVLVAAIQLIELSWLAVLTVAWVQQRRRHDRLIYRVSSLSKTVTKVGRMRHSTASQPAVTELRLATSLPPPPFPFSPPSTNPITSPTTGRHSAT